MTRGIGRCGLVSAEGAKIYVDKMVAAGNECDFVQEVAVNYPLLILSLVSKAALLTARHASTTVMAVIVAVAAVLIGLWAPGRDGRQLRPVRRMASGRHRA